MVINFECQKSESDGYYNERDIFIVPGCENFFDHNIYIQIGKSDSETLNGTYSTQENCIIGHLAFYDSPNEVMDAKINMNDFSLEVSVYGDSANDNKSFKCIKREYILYDSPSTSGLCSPEYSCILYNSLHQKRLLQELYQENKLMLQ
ncbi:MAG: hypothetical protein KTV77_04670 [Wolbachia endosymbiont of Fragariocoptes setiger]|nr:hypothetical protein [Wolbachia endosymbiont of Fragariocoptes setiger]